jgi:hypothetical protein
MFEIELNIVFGMYFGDWEKGRWEKEQNWGLRHP